MKRTWFDEHGIADGTRTLPFFAGAMHYWRVPRGRWPLCLRAMHDQGFTIVETYVPWRVHQPVHDEPAKLDDLAAFLEAAQAAGLSVVLRPGPHVNAELTSFGIPDWVLGEAACQARTAHDTPAWLPVPPRAFPIPSYASAAFHAHVRAWYAAVAEVVKPFLGAPVVGSAESWKQMLEPQRLTGGWSTRYGLGLFCETYRGVDVIHHPGDVMSGNSQMLKVPGARLDISIGTNRSDASASVLALKVIDAMVDGLAPVPETADYEKRTGAFVSRRDGRVVTLTAKDDFHLLAIDGGVAIPVAPDESGVLQLPAAAAFFQRSVRVEENAIVLSDFADEDRLEEVAIDESATVGTRVGHYRSEDFDLTVLVTEDGEGASASLRGRHGWADYRMTPVTADVWRIEQVGFSPIGGIMTFEAGALRLDFGPVHHIRLARIG